MEKASRTRRQAASVLETAEAESDRTGNQTKAKVKKKGHGLSEKETQVINKEDKSTTEKMEVGGKKGTVYRISQGFRGCRIHVPGHTNRGLDSLDSCHVLFTSATVPLFMC